MSVSLKTRGRSFVLQNYIVLFVFAWYVAPVAKWIRCLPPKSSQDVLAIRILLSGEDRGFNSHQVYFAFAPFFCLVQPGLINSSWQGTCDGMPAPAGPGQAGSQPVHYSAGTRSDFKSAFARSTVMGPCGREQQRRALPLQIVACLVVRSRNAEISSQRSAEFAHKRLRNMFYLQQVRAPTGSVPTMAA